MEHVTGVAAANQPDRPTPQSDWNWPRAGTSGLNHSAPRVPSEFRSRERPRSAFSQAASSATAEVPASMSDDPQSRRPADEPAARRRPRSSCRSSTPKQVEQVSIEIARSGRLGGEEQENGHQGVRRGQSHVARLAGGGLDLAKSLIEKALGKNAAQTLDNVRQSIEAMPFGFLRHVDRQNLLTYIIDEHPQTIALILSHLPPTFGAEIISRPARPTGSWRSSAASPRWARPTRRSSAKSRRAWRAGCRA